MFVCVVLDIAVPTGYYGLCACLSFSPLLFFPLIFSLPVPFPTPSYPNCVHVLFIIHLFYMHIFPDGIGSLEFAQSLCFTDEPNALAHWLESVVLGAIFTILAAPVCPQPIGAALLTTSG